MQRRLFAFALVATLLGNVTSSGAEPPAPAVQATLARAEQLERQAKKRYDEAASTKAVPLVQGRRLLREQLRGPVHLHLEQEAVTNPAPSPPMIWRQLSFELRSRVSP